MIDVSLQTVVKLEIDAQIDRRTPVPMLNTFLLRSERQTFQLSDLLIGEEPRLGSAEGFHQAELKAHGIHGFTRHLRTRVQRARAFSPLLVETAKAPPHRLLGLWTAVFGQYLPRRSRRVQVWIIESRDNRW